jgi:hypothetical protein
MHVRMLAAVNHPYIAALLYSGSRERMEKLARTYARSMDRYFLACVMINSSVLD